MDEDQQSERGGDHIQRTRHVEGDAPVNAIKDELHTEEILTTEDRPL